MIGKAAPRTGDGTPLVAIGASAGGPAVLSMLLKQFPKSFPAAIVIIQHMDAEMAPGMATWLAQDSKLTVRLAAEGDRPTAGVALIAGTSDHLVLKGPIRLGYTPEPREYVYRPSVDAFFMSVTKMWRDAAVGVLLTGMGRDGAAGLKAMRDRGFHTIAQDAATSAVYGMPKAAARLEAAVEILPIDRIATRIETLVAQQVR
jgi:two-component system chemotaxis response regulator CheB/two-component system response regulator WspF